MWMKMIDTVACLIAGVINFFLTDTVKEQAWKLQVYESATCTNLQPVTLYIDTFSCFLTLSVFDDLALKKGSK